MSALNPILPMLHDYYRRADWSEAAANYVKSEGIDLDDVNAHVGTIAALLLTFHGNGLFDLDGNDLGVIIEIYAEDAESTVDLCAWPLAKPRSFATAIGAASILGSVNITNPASWTFGSYLKIHQTPLEWLKAGCQGVCILDYRYAPFELGQALGPLLAQDERHAAELRKFLCKSPVDPSQIIYLRNDISKAA